MAIGNFEISVKGNKVQVPVIRVCDTIIVVKGRFVRVAEIFDEYWLERRNLPDPLVVLDGIRNSDEKSDLFTFAQRIPDTEPRFDFPFEWENYAVIQMDTYDDWFRKKISSSARRNIRASEKRGVVVRASQFDDAYVRGIMAIYNESPIRQGRRFWHYGKDIAEVRAENGTYSERSTFLASYYQDEMIGYCKIVWDERSAAIMQIISRMKFYDKRPNNALLATAVRQCCSRGIPYLLYEKFVYGKKTESSLTKFKRSNGFVRMDVPRYFVPLTLKGKFALRAGLHKNQKERIPHWLTARLIDLRKKWYKFKIGEE